MRADLLTEIPTLERVLGTHATQLGSDFLAYRNHTYRVANLCAALAPTGCDHIEKIAVASAFHDLGIWAAATFDYLEPSAHLARAYLTQTGQPAWSPEIERMIADHHKVTASCADESWLVEPFRKADWVDVAVVRPERGVQDRLAGTWLVPM